MFELNPDVLTLGLLWLVAFLFSTTLHEASHAWAAYRLGDPTAYHGGQVTLNPWPHIRREPFGMVIVPILSFFLAGWMLGWASAPYDPRWAERHPRRAALMALAGPAANLVLVLLTGITIRIGMATGGLRAPDTLSITRITEATAGGDTLPILLSIFFALNLLLMTFNLLPLPPLDGSGALPLILPDRLIGTYRELLSHPAASLIGILVAWKVFEYLFWPILGLALKLLYPDITYG